MADCNIFTVLEILNATIKARMIPTTPLTAVAMPTPFVIFANTPALFVLPILFLCYYSSL